MYLPNYLHILAIYKQFRDAHSSQSYLWRLCWKLTQQPETCGLHLSQHD